MQQKVDLSTYNNGWYKQQIRASRLKQLLWFVVNAFFFINPLNPSSGIKVWLLRIFGAKIGKHVVIKPSVNIKYPWLLAIGDNTWVGEKVWIDNLCEIVIGKNVCLSQGAMLLTGNHDYTRVTFDLVVQQIRLEDGVWIGSRATVCPGVSCESHSVLTTLSVATRNLSAYGIYQGNPAKEVRKRMIVK
ncbi:MAG TPA: WcaF family extracellular polysaccharide biosynthesis acetyltransferase [Chitinophagaceae bacterium]|jgi:putative colanic acid biosynthesis acetyltransferase WcaF|nr:WcaF family extracellular polysaccharide biosynthesis acetyltransferase [Chitinophagaceae bacterium]